MYAKYLPHNGRCAHYEPIEKRHVKGEHVSSSHILSRELVGVTIPKEEM